MTPSFKEIGRNFVKGRLSRRVPSVSIKNELGTPLVGPVQMSSTTPTTLQSLYKALLRQANRFPQYNYRNYALRKIKEEFSTAKSTLKTSEELDKFIKAEQENLEQLKRMIKLQSLYFNESTKLVLEKEEEK